MLICVFIIARKEFLMNNLLIQVESFSESASVINALAGNTLSDAQASFVISLTNHGLSHSVRVIAQDRGYHIKQDIAGFTGLEMENVPKTLYDLEMPSDITESEKLSKVFNSILSRGMMDTVMPQITILIDDMGTNIMTYRDLANNIEVLYSIGLDSGTNIILATDIDCPESIYLNSNYINMHERESK